METADLAAKAAEAAGLMKALSNEHRLLILCHLISEGEMSVGALVERVGLSQSALSQHLARLRDEKLVAFRRESQTLHYRVADPRAGQLLELLRDMFCPDLKPAPYGPIRIAARPPVHDTPENEEAEGPKFMNTDPHLETARAQVEKALEALGARPVVRTFFDEPTFTATHVVHDPATGKAAIVDSVLDFDQPSGRTATDSADRVIAYVEEQGLSVEWLLETHAHADHLSAAPYLQERLGGRIAIGREILTVQNVFGKIFNEGTRFARDGSQFDRLFDDGDTFALGALAVTVLHVPGHTPADLAYVIGDAAFVGDTMFMPDYGSARADFPGGDARQLYRSIRRLMALPDRTRVFLCHDYKAANRDEFVWETTILAERTGNVHLHEGVSEDEFVAMRTQRDATLAMPRLILPSIQVNIRAGHLPEPEENGTRYLKLPLNVL